MVVTGQPELEQEDAAAETVDSSTVKSGTPETLEYVPSLTDPRVKTRLLHEFITYQRSLDSDIDTLLSQKTELERNFVEFQKSMEILDIMKTVLESEDCESTAKLVQRFLHIDSQYRDSGSDQREQLLVLKKQLDGIEKKKTIDQRVRLTILRFVRLYSPVGMEKGLQLNIGYLKKVIAMKGRMEYENVVEFMEQGLGQVNLFGGLINLSQDIVMAIEENDETLRDLCGEDGVVYAICEFQEECDSRGSFILKKYMEFRKLARLASDNNNPSNLNLLAGGASEEADPREVELYVEEILLLIHLGEDYTEFMVSKIKSLTSVDPELLQRATKTFRNISFSKVIQNLTGLYVILEEFFMVENVMKAVRIDKHVPDSLTTSMVDDVFYVLQSCLRRVISTLNISSEIVVLSNAANLLGNTVYKKKVFETVVTMTVKALTRKGTALGKMAKVSKDYEPVIETYQKAPTEHRNQDTFKRLNKAEKANKELEQQEFFYPSIGTEEREKGNEFFKEKKYSDAVRHYTELVKRGLLEFLSKDQEGKLRTDEKLAKVLKEKDALEADVAEVTSNAAKIKEIGSELEEKLKISDGNYNKTEPLLSQALSNKSELEQKLKLLQLKSGEAEQEVKKLSEKVSELKDSAEVSKEEKIQAITQMQEYKEKASDLEFSLNQSSVRNSELEENLRNTLRKGAEHEDRANTIHQRRIELEGLCKSSQSKHEDAEEMIMEEEEEVEVPVAKEQEKDRKPKAGYMRQKSEEGVDAMCPLEFTACNDLPSFRREIKEKSSDFDEQAILHRDVKCNNILLNSKYKVILTFLGLAKLMNSLIYHTDDVEENISNARDTAAGKAYGVKEIMVHKAQDAKRKVTTKKTHNVKGTMAHKIHESKEMEKDIVREKAHELKEKKRMDLQIYERKMQHEKEYNLIQKTHIDDTENEEAELRKRIKKQRDESKKEHMYREKEQAELKQQLKAHKQIMERFLKRSKDATWTEPKRLSATLGSATLGGICRTHFATQRQLGHSLTSSEKHWGMRRQSKSELFPKLNKRATSDVDLNLEKQGDKCEVKNIDLSVWDSTETLKLFESAVTRSCLGKIKFADKRSLLGVQDVKKYIFELKGDNVGLSSMMSS